MHKLAKLKEILGADFVKSDPATLSAYALDGLRPWSVLFPDSLAQISEVVKLALEERWTMLPWGSGSKMGQGNPTSRLDLVLSTTRLNRIIDMDTANLTVTAQAGVRFRDIQIALAGEENRCYLPYEEAAKISDVPVCSDREHTGCFIPLMPPHINSATLGGIIAANSSGPTRLLYGLPRDMVLGVRYVAPNGEIVGMGGKTVKNVSGYDMGKLMIGSLGSLGILCEMTLRLLPLPERVGSCLAGFATLKKASGFIDRIFGTRLLPAAVELLNRKTMAFLTTEAGVEMDRSQYAVALSLEGCEEAVDRMGTEIREMALAAGAEKEVYLQEDAHKKFWSAYSNLVPELTASYPDLVSLKVNYPISEYLDVIQLAGSLCSKYKLDNALQARAGNGLALVHVPVELKDDRSAGRVVTFAEELLKRCESSGGNLTIERAGLDLKPRLPLWGAPGKDLMIMKRIKEEVDPAGLFCPGRFVGGI